MEKQYKVILLDWDDTIGDFNHSALLSLQEIFKKYHLYLLYPSFDSFYSIYHEHNLNLWERYGNNEINKTYLNHDRFLYPLSHAINKPHPYCFQNLPLDNVADLIAADFMKLTTKYFTVLPEARVVIPYLAERYQLSVVSNGFTEVQYDKIERSGLQQYFTYIVLSEEVGAQKPNPQIFQKALALNSCTSQEALMIGDGYTSDIQGAKNANIDQIWVTKEYKPHQTATYIVSSLSNVMDIL